MNIIRLLFCLLFFVFQFFSQLKGQHYYQLTENIVALIPLDNDTLRIYLYKEEIFELDSIRNDTIILKFGFWGLDVLDEFVEEYNDEFSFNHLELNSLIKADSIDNRIRLDLSELLNKESIKEVHVVQDGQDLKIPFISETTYKAPENTSHLRVFIPNNPSVIFDKKTINSLQSIEEIPPNKENKLTQQGQPIIEKDSLNTVIKEKNLLLNNLHKRIKTLLFLTLGLGSLFLIYLVLALKQGKQNHLELEQYKKSIINLQKENVELRSKIANSEKRVLESGQRRQQILLPPKSTSESNKSFKAELMISAGPRKKITDDIANADTDLGEDVGGFLQIRNQLYFWILDGTSQSSIIRNKRGEDLFSSRYLAQCIARNFQRLLAVEQPERSIKDILIDSISLTKEDWENNFDQLDNDFRKELLEALIESVSKEASTTIVVGRLSLDGKLESCRVGDSFLLAFDKEKNHVVTNLSRKPSRSVYDRQFFRLRNNNNQFSLLFNKVMIECIEEKNIQTVFSFSDGVNSSTRVLLSNNFKYIEDDKLRDIIAKIPQRSEDDKSLLHIQIIDSVV